MSCKSQCDPIAGFEQFRAARLRGPALGFEESHIGARLGVEVRFSQLLVGSYAPEIPNESAE
jgi:hypothetical protein